MSFIPPVPHGYLNVNGTLVPIQRANVDHSTTTSEDVVPAVTSTVLRLLAASLNVGTNNVEFVWGSDGVAITASHLIASRGEYYRNELSEGWIAETNAGEALTLEQLQTPASTLTGYVLYVEMP